MKRNYLSKPGVVDFIPDVEHLFLDLFFAYVVSTQHIAQL